MVSKFLIEEYNKLKLNLQQYQKNPFILEEAYVYLQLGKNQKGFWISKHLIE